MPPPFQNLRRSAALLALLLPLTTARAAAPKTGPELDQADNDWSSQSFLDGYQHAGQHDPAWDNDAATALRLWNTTGDSPAIRAALDRALAAQCTDPLIRFLSVIESPASQGQVAKSQYAVVSSAFNKVRTADYGAYVTMTCALKAAQVYFRNSGLYHNSSDLSAVQRLLDEALAQYPLASKTYTLKATLIEGRMIDLMQDYQRIAGSSVGNVYAAYQVLPAVAAADGPDSYMLHLLRGYYYAFFVVQYQPELSTPALAQIADYRARAKKDFARAYQLNPQSANVLYNAMLVADTRPELDLWFNRLLTLSPEHFEAHLRYTLWLRDHEGMDSALTFARSLVAKCPPKSDLPLVLISLYMKTAVAPGPFAGSTVPDEDYYRRPGVFQDIRTAYDKFLKAHPGNTVGRSNYARLACYAQQWTIADQQFSLLGDHADYSAFGSKNNYEQLKAQAAANAHP